MRLGTPWQGIKQIRHPLVKLAAVLMLSLAILGTGLSVASRVCRADDDENPPDIEAKTFNVKVMRRSRSGNVYVLETEEEQPLHTGKLLLLRENDQPVMALRVLKDYPEKNQFAAKWLRRYRGIDKLEPTTSYLAIEKIADREAPPLTAQDKTDLKDVEGELPPPAAEQPAPAKPYDSELDATTSPAPKSTPETSNRSTTAPDLTPADEQEIDELKDITAEELVLLDRNKNWLNLGYEIFRQNGATPNSYTGYFGGFDLKYARTLKELIYLKKKNLQDSFSVEGNLGYYRVLNFVGLFTGDSYSVVPITLTGRYNLVFSQDFTVFGYLGINFNLLAGASQGGTSAADFQAAKSQLNSVLPAVGVGMLFRIGPDWYIRFDGGLDQLGIGLTLRY